MTHRHPFGGRGRRSAPRVSVATARVAAMTDDVIEPIEPTRQVCPGSRHGDTHHLVPNGRGEMRCRYCGKQRHELARARQ